MKVNVYQFHLTREEYDAVNRDGWDATERTQQYCEKNMLDIRTNAGDAGQYAATNMHEYNLVTTVDADSDDVFDALEIAYRAMNLWDNPDMIQRHRDCASMSVGDICEVAGRLFVCASVGFEEFKLGEVA